MLHILRGERGPVLTRFSSATKREQLHLTRFNRNQNWIRSIEQNWTESVTRKYTLSQSTPSCSVARVNCAHLACQQHTHHTQSRPVSFRPKRTCTIDTCRRSESTHSFRTRTPRGTARNIVRPHRCCGCRTNRCGRKNNLK